MQFHLEILCNYITYYNIIMESLNNVNIRNAVRLWGIHKKDAILKYGHISNWNVSNVTNMQLLFNDMRNFNNNINNWNVSNVSNMYAMFYNAISFNQNISNWNVSNVLNMEYMFYNAISFNQNISNWNILNNIHVYNMFCFNSPISFHKLKTTSFFDKPYKKIEPLKRKKNI